MINDPSAVALQALGWILSDDDRAGRFLALTGLTPEGLRDGIETGEVQRAVLEFLTAHEPDLLAASEALGIAPAQLVAAGERLGA